MTHPRMLTAEERTFFREHGYLIVENVVSDEALSRVEAEYAEILDREVPRLVQEGKVAEAHDGLGFAERYPKILHQLADMYDLYQHLDISLPLLHRMAPDATLNAGPAVFSEILRCPEILDIAESLIGPELTCSPVQHTRIKPPKSALPSATDSNVARTMWHQDAAVIEAGGAEDMLTVWVAMTDATEENGCMIAIPGSHRQTHDLVMHCPGNSFSSAEIFIPDALADDPYVPLPVGRGGVVLLDQRTVHGSLDNRTDAIRWSFDLRYYGTGQASGRDIFPSFVARSRENPEAELSDPALYRAAWFDARDRLSVRGEVAFNARWSRFSDHAMCA